MDEFKTKPLATELLVSAAYLTDIGRERLNNEDALVVADLTESVIETQPGEFSERSVGRLGWLLATADGMGGAQAGEVASRIATTQLAKSLISSDATMPVADRLREGLISANREIRRVGEQQPECSGMGATITAAIIIDGAAVIGQVGDSRGYLIREGRIKQITKDQSVVQAMLDAGVITPEEAALSPHRNVILNALGVKDELKPELSMVSLADGDLLLLCSDGLSNKVSDAEMQQIVCNADTLGAACKQLVALANEHGGQDNITLVLARFADASR